MRTTLFLLAFLLAGMATVPPLGGRLRALAEVDFRWPWAVVAAIGLQILVISVIPGRFHDLHVPLHVLSYAFAGAFVIANLRLAGVWLIGAGGALNLAVIAANGGVMPASEAALAAAGIVQEAGTFANSTALADAKLMFLGDVFYIPASVPVLNNVFSIGDVLIAAGVVVLVHGICGSRLVPPWVAIPWGPRPEAR